MNKVLLIFISLLLYSNCFAQTPSVPPDTTKKYPSQIYVETDPTALFFSGFSFAIKRSSTFHKQLNIGLGVYKTTLPDFYIENVESNIGEGWQANNFGLDLFSDYFFFDPNKGLSLGLALSYYNFNISRLGIEDNYQTAVETLRIGYLWRPLKKLESIYLFPWIGLSTSQKVSGNNVIAGETFILSKWSFVPAFQAGFSF